MVAGQNVSPKDRAATEKLMQYWAKGPGAAKIRWGTPNDFTRCMRELRKYVGEARVGGLCQNLHKRALGTTNPESGGRR